MDLNASMNIAASGMRAQGHRLRVISENLANADSTALTPEGLPYRRQTVVFQNTLNRELGVELVEVANVNTDPSPFRSEYRPGHPSADPEGYVLTPNVSSLIEMMDMREAQRSYEANLNVVTTARQMAMKTLELLRA